MTMPFPIEYIVLTLSTLILILVLLQIRTEIRLHRLLRGKDAKTLEDTIRQIAQDFSQLSKRTTDIEGYMRTAEERIKRSVQGVGTVRFNAFKGTGSGGNQSFAVAILSENGNGVVFSSLYSRERVSVYAKPITNGRSEIELTEEEEEALRLAESRS